jgi:hypothetical protein
MKAVRPVLAVAGALALTSFLVTAGCSGGGGGGAGGTGGGGAGSGGSSGPVDGACSATTRIGGFAVQLVAVAGSAPYTSIAGGVRNGVNPREVWQQKGAAAGGCKLMVGPTLVCSTPCVSPQICAGQNQCIDEPRLQGLGTVTVTGVGPSPITIEPIQEVVYSKTLLEPYPPFSPGAAVNLATTGGTIPAFALDAKGIEPLAFEGANLTMRNGEALALTWTPPATATGEPILIQADIGHHGGIAASIECELPDTGSGEIPAAMVSALIAEGTAGFPSLSLTRRSISSKTVGSGCVELAVAAPVERVIGVCPTPTSCIVSCDPGDPTIVCPSGMTCQLDWKCG